MPTARRGHVAARERLALERLTLADFACQWHTAFNSLAADGVIEPAARARANRLRPCSRYGLGVPRTSSMSFRGAPMSAM